MTTTTIYGDIQIQMYHHVIKLKVLSLSLLSTGQNLPTNYQRDDLTSNFIFDMLLYINYFIKTHNK